MAETQYGHTKIALEENSYTRKWLITFGMRKMGGTMDCFVRPIGQKHVHSFCIWAQEFWVKSWTLENLLFLSNAHLSTDICQLSRYDWKHFCN